jgi:hypothetical protein
MERWYIPSWCGDFRLEADGDDTCKLLVTDPTPAEIMLLGKFLTKARKKEWCSSVCGIAERGESVLTLKASVTKAGLELLSRGEVKGLKKRKAILTTVKSTSGEVIAIAGGEGLAESLDKVKDKKEAVTSKRPTLCCPTPISGPEQRASDVLKAFSTTQQWQDWMEYGFLVCRGNLTGHPYRVCHRHSDLASKQGKIAWDLHDDHVVHCYDWSVPPAEEVLGAKLCFEHAEHWIRNRSGYFGPEPRFHNPFRSDNEQGMDGVEDSAFVGTIGLAVKTQGPLLQMIDLVLQMKQGVKN